MKYALSLLVTIFILLVARQLVAQRENPARVEINARMESDIFKVVPCSDKGVLVFYETVNKLDDANTIWVFTLFNKKLQQVWSKEIAVITGALYQKFRLSDRNAYLVFYKEGKTKDDEPNLQVIKYNFGNEDFIGVRGSIEDKAELIDIEQAGNVVYIGFNLKKFATAVYAANCNNSSINAITTQTDGKNLIEDIYIDPHSTSINVVENHFVSRRENYLRIHPFQFDGKPLETIRINVNDEEFELNSARMISLNKNEKLILGTYNNSDAQTSDLKSDEENISAGVFSAKIVNGVQTLIKTYNFLDFKNFSSYIQMPAYMKYKKRDKKSDSRDYSLNYRLLLHDIVPSDTQFVFLAESYYPEFRTVSHITYDYFGRPYPQTYTVFEGYKYFGGIISGFDSDGNILWDNGIKIWNLQTFDLKKKINSFFDGSDLVLAYNSLGKIASEIYHNGMIVGDFEYLNLETKYKKDKIIDDENSNMIKWYGNYFLCYGYQEIRNNALRNADKRTVFYMNKVAFD